MTDLYQGQGYPARFGGLKKVLRKVGPLVATAGAIAVGQPQLAVPLSQGISSATKKKRRAVEPPIETPPPGLFASLTQSDRNAVMIGGAVVGTLVLSQLLLRRR